MRKGLVEPSHPQLSIRRQCELLGVNRNRLEVREAKASEEDLRLMRLLDELHLREPCYGARRMCQVLARDHGIRTTRKRMGRLMRWMGIEPIWPKPHTSRPGSPHRLYPYLLRGLSITRPNQVWCADITYIPMAHGYCYLMVVMDWYSRKVLGWAVATTMDVALCLEAFRMAVRVADTIPEILNTDQGSQFTSAEWIGELTGHAGLRISMDGRGRWLDNVFIERLWWSVKYEDVYLKAYESPRDLEIGLATWFARYNDYRPHAALGGQTPAECHAHTPSSEAA
jgi:putative transposase